MFDWNENQAGDTIGGEFRDNEDHIVPYPRDSEEDALLTYGDYNKKQKTEQCIAGTWPNQHSSGERNELPGCDMDKIHGDTTTEEFSAPRLDIDMWPDLPSLSDAFSKGYNGESNQDSLQTGLMSDFSEASNLNKVRVQLEGADEFFGSELEDKEGTNFLDCDWASIGDLDDLESIFRNNDSIFGHDIGSSADEFLSPSVEVITGTAQSIPMPDMPMSREHRSNQECYPHRFTEHGAGIRKTDKTANTTVKIEEQTVCQANLSGIHSQPPEKLDKDSRGPKSRKKAEESTKNSISQNSNGAWSNNISQNQQLPSPEMQTSVSTSLQTFLYPAINHRKQVGDFAHLGHPSSSNQFMFSGYGYSAYPLPAVPMVPCAPAEMNRRTSLVGGCKSTSDPSKQSNELAKLQDISKPLLMTPQEKIEKLRRRQQMQAMLAIRQQQQRFDKQIAGSDGVVSQLCSKKNQNQDILMSADGVETCKCASSEVSTLVEQDGSNWFSLSTDNQSLEEAIYHGLQDALRKLDVRVRLCIRDSLFRLAKSAMERQGASDRSSTNNGNKDDDEVSPNMKANYQDRCARFTDAETMTNPIDRTVAHLLFHKPSDTTMQSVKDELPRSPMLSNSVPFNTSGGISVDQSENNIEEMELQHSI